MQSIQCTMQREKCVYVCLYTSTTIWKHTISQLWCALVLPRHYLAYSSTQCFSVQIKSECKPGVFLRLHRSPAGTLRRRNGRPGKPREGEKPGPWWVCLRESPEQGMWKCHQTQTRTYCEWFGVNICDWLWRKYIINLADECSESEQSALICSIMERCSVRAGVWRHRAQTLH